MSRTVFIWSVIFGKENEAQGTRENKNVRDIINGRVGPTTARRV